MIEAEQEEITTDPVGGRLKAAREAQGMTLDDIAAKTRVPIRHLQHMERGEWAELPATTYSVGFARAYASAVGLNASEIGAELRAHLGAAQNVAAPSYYEPADPARVPPRSLAIAAAIIAVLLAAAYFIWRNNAVDESQVVASETTPAATPSAVAGPPASPPAPAATLTPAVATGPVVLTATSDVWLRVYEAGGRKLYEDMLKAGDRYEVPATANKPQLLTGRPDALRVTIGGVAIPPLGQADRTIADLSLLPADLAARASRQAQASGGTAPAAALPPSTAPAAPAPAAR